MWLSLLADNNQAINNSNPVSRQVAFHLATLIKRNLLHCSGKICVFWVCFFFNTARSSLCPPSQVSCKVLAVLTVYTATANYFWMLCEGIYLHTLIIVAVFVGEQHLFWYYVLGWGESRWR